MSLSCLLFWAGRRRYALESKLIARVVESDEALARAALRIEHLDGDQRPAGAPVAAACAAEATSEGNSQVDRVIVRLLVVRAAGGEFALRVSGILSLEQFDEQSILPLPDGYFERSPVSALIAEEQSAALLLDVNHLFRVSKCETSVLA